MHRFISSHFYCRGGVIIDLKGEINALLIVTTEMTLAIKGKLKCSTHAEKAESGWHILSLKLLSIIIFTWEQ